MADSILSAVLSDLSCPPLTAPSATNEVDVVTAREEVWSVRDVSCVVGVGCEGVGSELGGGASCESLSERGRELP